MAEDNSILHTSVSSDTFLQLCIWRWDECTNHEIDNSYQQNHQQNQLGLQYTCTEIIAYNFTILHGQQNTLTYSSNMATSVHQVNTDLLLPPAVFFLHLFWTRAASQDRPKLFISYHIISYQGFLVHPLLREPRPQVHYKSQPDATAQRETQKSANVKSYLSVCAVFLSHIWQISLMNCSIHLLLLPMIFIEIVNLCPCVI